ncbi:MAG: hypothetical protein ABJ004_07000 [Cyclobacteriaceae bacterium]
MKLRFALVLVLSITSYALLFGQYKNPNSRKSPSSMKKGSPLSLDRFYFGGGGGFSGGSDYINVSISPTVGYKITEQFSTGLAFSYQFVKFKTTDTKLKNYGVGPFLRFNFSEKIFSYTELEYLSFEYVQFGERRREGFTSWFVGLGYSEPISDNLSFNIFALYNLLFADGTDTPYSSPLQFRVGLVGGF